MRRTTKTKTTTKNALMLTKRLVVKSMMPKIMMARKGAMTVRWRQGREEQ